MRKLVVVGVLLLAVVVVYAFWYHNYLIDTSEFSEQQERVSMSEGEHADQPLFQEPSAVKVGEKTVLDEPQPLLLWQKMAEGVTPSFDLKQPAKKLIPVIVDEAKFFSVVPGESLRLVMPDRHFDVRVKRLLDNVGDGNWSGVIEGTGELVVSAAVDDEIRMSIHSVHGFYFLWSKGGEGYAYLIEPPEADNNDLRHSIDNGAQHASP